MNDTKFLGICILIAALIVSGTIIWSTNANRDAMAHLFNGTSSISVTGIPNSIQIAGPVSIAPSTTPMAVSVSGGDTPVGVKAVSDQKWFR
jgi:hypothetical protein